MLQGKWEIKNHFSTIFHFSFGHGKGVEEKMRVATQEWYQTVLYRLKSRNYLKKLGESKNAAYFNVTDTADSPLTIKFIQRPSEQHEQSGTTIVDNNKQIKVLCAKSSFQPCIYRLVFLSAIITVSCAPTQARRSQNTENFARAKQHEVVTSTIRMTQLRV